MSSLDLWLIEKANKLTAKAQHNGHKLTRLQVEVTAITLLTGIINGAAPPFSRVAVLIAALVWGANLAMAIRHHSKNHDYTESVSKTNHLNAVVVSAIVEMQPFRDFLVIPLVLMTLLIQAVLVFDGNYVAAIAGGSHMLSVTAWLYLNCCFYKGPGEFAKEEQKAYDDAFVTQNGAP